MRVQNLQELIYKRGQAGITKASVTIVFDNSDRMLSPVGLENCKQITVTRQVGMFSLLSIVVTDTFIDRLLCPISQNFFSMVTRHKCTLS